LGDALNLGERAGPDLAGGGPGAKQFVFKISNLCDHKSQITNVTGDGQTDGQTDDMRSQDRANALKCIAR